MWTFLVACTALEALTQPTVQPPSPTPAPVRDGSLGYAVVIDGPGQRPWGDELPGDDALYADDAPLGPYSVSATLLLNPAHPWMDEVIERAHTDPRSMEVLQNALASAEACEWAMGRTPAVPWQALMLCPYSEREAILKRYDSAEARQTFARQELPDGLAAAYSHGEQHPMPDAFRHPDSHARIAKATERCIADRTDAAPACVEGLAMTRWDRAAQHAELLDGDSTLRNALEAYPTDAAIDDRLHELGFERATGPGDVLRRLWNGGYVFSPSDTPFAELLRMLDVREIDVAMHLAPPADRAVLYVYSKGQRTRLLTQSSTDPEQLAGFANVLARRQDRPLRALWVEDAMWGSLVVTGPPKALEALVSEGLVLAPEPTPPSPLVDTGVPPASRIDNP
jgi:hypothetical protein